MRIATRLSLTTLVVIAVSVAGSLTLVALIGRRVLEAQAQEANQSSAETYASAVGYYLAAARSTLEVAAALMPGVGSQSEATGHRVADVVLSNTPMFEYVLVLDAAGNLTHWGPHDLQPARLDFAYTTWFHRLEENRGTSMGDLEISPVTLRPSVVIVVPVRDARGDVTSILAGGLRLSDLSRLGLDPGAGGAPTRYGFVTDSRGLVVAHQAGTRYVTDQADFSATPPVAEALAGRRGTISYVSPIDGIEKLGAYLPLENTGWTIVFVEHASTLFAPLARLTRGLAGLGALTCLIMMGLMYLSAIRPLTVPLESLRRATERIGEGDLTAHVDLDRTDELGRLGDTLNDMSVRLARRTAELVEANKELETFSYSVAHDLRAPLRSIDGFSLAILEDHAGALPIAAREDLARVRAASRRMGQLIDQLLSFSRIARGELAHETVGFSGLAAEITRDLCARSPGRKVVWTIAPGMQAQGDPQLLRLVLENLLGNAWKFTERRDVAHVEMGTESMDGRTVYYVRDDGVGFDMAYVAKLFLPFQRLHSPDEFAGTGVGLATVGRVLKRHGGRIWAEGNVGSGATFRFTVGDYGEGDTMDSLHHVLLVEDNPDDVELTLRAFRKSNILNDVVVARDGEEALEKLLAPGASLPQIVLLDLKLPKVDGIEVLRRIRGDERTRMLPVIIMTSSREEQDVAAGYRNGANSYIRKPVDFTQFVDAVRQLGLYWLVLNESPPLT